MATEDDTTPPLAGDDSTKKLRLIESIYKIALEPQTYDAFMGHWNEFIQDRLVALETLKTEGADITTDEVANHFAIAERILEQTKSPSANQNLAPPYSQGSASPGPDPQFLVSPDAGVVWSNAAATRMFGINGRTPLADLGFAERNLAALEDRLEAMKTSQGGLDAPVIVQLPVKNDSDGLCAGDTVHLQAQRIQDTTDSDLLLISALQASWPTEMPRLLMETYGLSHSECEICELISRAHKPADIAEMRGSAIATVRTQIKSVMTKTGCSSQTELVKLLHLLMRVAERYGPSSPAGPISQGDMTSLQMSSGYILPVEMHGPLDGTPVIFLHGMLDGASLVSKLRKGLHERGYRFICPTRPWFGEAQPDYGPVEDAPTRFGHVLREMCQRLNIEKPILMGHMGGSLYALAAAAVDPDNIRAIVNVAGGVPIVSKSQFATMSHRQRVVAYTALYTPQLLPFVLRAGISQINSGGEERFMRSLYASAPLDMEVLSDPEIRRLIMNGYRFATNQGHNAFRVDSYHVVRDWSPIVGQSTCPIYLLHGEHDPVVSAQSVRAFAKRYGNRARVSVHEDAGQLILHQYPERALDMLEDALTETAHG